MTCSKIRNSELTTLSQSPCEIIIALACIVMLPIESEAIVDVRQPLILEEQGEILGGHHV
jgi:hypothetical protein